MDIEQNLFSVRIIWFIFQWTFLPEGCKYARLLVAIGISLLLLYWQKSESKKRRLNIFEEDSWL